MKSIVRGRAAAAFVLTLSLLVTQALAAPATPAGERGRLLGEMTSFGHVLVNGDEATSGATVFPGSRFTTAKESGAIINLGALGRVRLAPETSSLINFGEQGLQGVLEGGVITVSKPEGVTALFTTKDAQVVPAVGTNAIFTVTVKNGNTVVKTEAGSVELRSGTTTKVIAAGQSGTAGTAQTSDDDDDDTGGLFWLGVAGFTGIVVGAIIWTMTNDDDAVNGGTTPIVQVPSPSR
jgi:hypothetical protein